MNSDIKIYLLIQYGIFVINLTFVKQLLVCGTGEVSVTDWRAHALVNGSGREFERVLAWFWAAVTNFSTEERARLLQFTTGCSQLPPGGFQV